MGTFEHDRRIGREGEEAFAKLLQSDPLHVDLKDVRDDLAHRVSDVDFVWTTSRGRYAIEVKTEQRFTGNIFLETISNVAAGSAGWYVYSSAEYVAQGFLDRRRWYVYSLPKLRRAVTPVQNRLERRYAGTKVKGGGYQTEGLLLPISSMQLRFALLRTVEGDATPEMTLAPLEGAIEHPVLGIGMVENVEEKHVVCRFGVESALVFLDLNTVLAKRLLRATDGDALGLEDLRRLARGTLERPSRSSLGIGGRRRQLGGF